MFLENDLQTLLDDFPFHVRRRMLTQHNGDASNGLFSIKIVRTAGLKEIWKLLDQRGRQT